MRRKERGPRRRAVDLRGASPPFQRRVRANGLAAPGSAASAAPRAAPLRAGPAGRRRGRGASTPLVRRARWWRQAPMHRRTAKSRQSRQLKLREWPATLRKAKACDGCSTILASPNRTTNGRGEGRRKGRAPRPRVAIWEFGETRGTEPSFPGPVRRKAAGSLRFAPMLRISLGRIGLRGASAQPASPQPPRGDDRSPARNVGNGPAFRRPPEPCTCLLDPVSKC